MDCRRPRSKAGPRATAATVSWMADAGSGSPASWNATDAPSARRERRSGSVERPGHHLDVEPLALDASIVIDECLRDADDGIHEDGGARRDHRLHDETVGDD